MAHVKHQCPMCDYSAPRAKFEKHIIENHNLNLSDYLWYYYFKNEGKPICPICGNPIVLYRFDENKKTCGNHSCLSTLAIITSKENGTFNNRIAKLNLTSEQRSIMTKNAWANPNSKLNSHEYRDKLSKAMSITMTKLNKTSDFKKKQLSGRIDLDKPGIVYLVKYKDKCKIGFSSNLKARLKWLGSPELISTKNFSNSRDALDYEYYIHSKEAESALNTGELNSTEEYPLAELDRLKDTYFN